MRRLTTLFAILALTLAACGGAADETAEEPTPTTAETAEEPTPTADDTSTEGMETATPSEGATTTTDGATTTELTATCENDLFAIDYPSGWDTNSGDVTRTCRVFHPGEVQLEEGTDVSLHYAAQLWTDQAPFETVAQAQEGDEVISREETTVDGHDAVVLEYEVHSEGLVPEGETVYRYAVDLGDERTLTAVTYSIGDVDFEREQRILDRMVGTLQFSTA